MKRLKEINFVIVGDGEELRKKSKNFPKNVKWIGPRFGKDLVKLYNDALVYFLPSLNEGFGLTLLEAMASGCAIVSTVPLDYEGFRVEVGDVEGMVKAIEWLFQNKEKAIKMGKLNREKAKNYTWKNFVKKLISIYEEVLIEHKFKQ